MYFKSWTHTVLWKQNRSQVKEVCMEVVTGDQNRIWEEWE